VRGRAIEWFVANASFRHQPTLTEALEAESVPSLRRQLSVAVRKARTGDEARVAHPHSYEQDPISSEILESLASLIRHETEPVIGWLRRSAAHEIGAGYDDSETFKNIDLLRQRLGGLEALAAAHRVPRWTRVSLAQILSDCRPPDLTTNNGSSPTDDAVDTDVGLMTIIIGNALQNAQEATAALEDGTVWIEFGVTDRDFWISITNRFEGQSFELDQVAHTGTSSKTSHKGLGVSAMRLAAERLGYEISLSAKGGTAFFSLRGSRRRG